MYRYVHIISPVNICSRIVIHTWLNKISFRSMCGSRIFFYEGRLGVGDGVRRESEGKLWLPGEGGGVVRGIFSVIFLCSFKKLEFCCAPLLNPPGYIFFIIDIDINNLIDCLILLNIMILYLCRISIYSKYDSLWRHDLIL